MKKYIEIIKHIAEDKDIVPKVVCILLAVMLWGYITNTGSARIKFKIPVTYKNLDETLTVSKISTKNIVVSLSGKKDDLKSSFVKNIKLFIDLSNAEIGIYKPYKVQQTTGDIPQGFDFELDPDEVKVLVEKK